MNKTNEDNIKKYKKKLIAVFLSTSDPMTYEELTYEMEGIDVPENFLDRMLKSLENNNIICKEPHNGKDTYILTHFGRRRLSVISKRNKIREARRKRKIAIGVICLIAVILVLVWCVLFAGQNGEDGNNSEGMGDPQASTEISPESLNGNLVDGIGSGSGALSGGNVTYETITLSEDDIHNGPLMLVNSDNRYEGEPEGLVSVAELGVNAFTVSSTSLVVRQEVIDQLNIMITEYNSDTQRSDIMVTSAYRSVADQQEIYDENVSLYGDSYANTNVQTPGASDSHTGYALSFSLYSDGQSASIRGTEAETWLSENARDYGFILRFPEGKDEITGFSYRASNYRYVGVPHAVYIEENGLCLEEYLDLLKNSYGYEGEHLEISCDSGVYGVYYASGTTISVPRNTEYTISGNNSDGFIVTYLISEAAE